MRRARIEGPITHRTPLVDREPMEIEFARNTFSWGISLRGTRARGPNPRNLIGRPGTNGNRDRRKHVFLGYHDVGRTNPGCKHVETTIVVKEFRLRS